MSQLYKKNIMKKFYSLFFVLITVMLLKAQGNINFDDDTKWIKDPAATSLSTSYGSHGYSDTNFTATGARVIRNTTSAQDGFPGAFGTYSFRLEGTANSSLTMTVGTGGIGTFSFKVRRWDGSPATNFAVEYTTDGTTWNNVITVNASLTTNSDWKTVSGSIQSTNNNVSVRIRSLGTTERIMVDDFSWTLPSSDPALSVSTSNINFGEVIIPNTSSPSTVTISASNLSVAPTYTITGTDAAMFSATGTLTTSGGSLDVTFAPTSIGAKSATLTITSGSANATVALTGVGVSADNPFSLDETSPVSALVENFETGVVGSTVMPNNWKTASEGAIDKKWSIKTFNSNKYAEMTAFNGTGTYNTWLISPAINLDQINKTSVKFDWNSGYANGAELKVYVLKLNSGVMVKNLVTTINDNVNTAGYGAAYSTETLDLSAYSGVGFLAFEYVGDSAIPATTTYQLDNINITSFLGVKDVIKSKNVFLKNTIVNDALSFETKGNATVKLYNSNGQLVKSFNITPNNKTINVSSLQKGVYIVSSELNGETVSQKIVKQ
ncbi:MAG: T9SS type A sorting domain-containing protein [Cloacibacterium normanense]